MSNQSPQKGEQVTVQQVAEEIAQQIINTETQMAGLSAQLGMLAGTLKGLRERYVSLIQQVFKKLDELSPKEEEKLSIPSPE